MSNSLLRDIRNGSNVDGAMKPWRSISERPADSREFLVGFVGTIVILTIILGLPTLALFISFLGTIVYQSFFCIVPVMFTLGGFQLLYRLIKARRGWALLGVATALLLIALAGLVIYFLFRISS